MANQYMYICPSCKNTFPCDSDLVQLCTNCKIKMAPLGYTKDEWYKLPIEDRRHAKVSAIPGGSSLLDQEKDEELQRKKADGLKYSIVGVRGRSIEVYSYKLVISTDVTVGSVLTQNATDGEKTIYFSDIIGVQYKDPGLTIGYIQFETAANLGNNENSNFFSENTFTFGPLTDEITEMYRYIMGQLDTYKKRLFLGDGAV